MQITTLDTETALASRGSLFVVNTSDRNRSQPKGVIVFTVTEADKNTVTITLPKTFIPLDVTSWASMDSLRNSNEFRTLLRKGAIVAVDANEARKYLATDVAQKEVVRLRQDKGVGTAISATKFNLNTGTMVTPDMPSNATPVGNTVDMALTQLVEQFNNGGDDELLAAELRTMKHLTVEDVVWATDKIKATDSTFFRALSEVLDNTGEDFRS